MNCPPVGTFYRYLEGELSPSEERSIQDHLQLCPSCRLAMEDRRYLNQAAGMISHWETPPGFTQKTMARLVKKTSSGWVPLLAIAAGFATSTLLVFTYLWVTGQNLASFFLGLNRTFLTMIKTVSVGTVKALKLISILTKAMKQLSSVVLSGLGRFSDLMSMEFQIILVLAACLLYLSLFLALRRKKTVGAKI